MERACVIGESGGYFVTCTCCLFPKQRLRYGVLTRVLIPGVVKPPPGRLRGCSFLLLFTALGDGTMRLVQARRSVMHVLTVKHNGFERSNAPIRHVVQIPPEPPNGPQMLHISMAELTHITNIPYISNELMNK